MLSCVVSALCVGCCIFVFLIVYIFFDYCPLCVSLMDLCPLLMPALHKVHAFLRHAAFLRHIPSE
jgi:hypothetical protein